MNEAVFSDYPEVDIDDIYELCKKESCEEIDEL